jgi:hypothetical protein
MKRLLASLLAGLLLAGCGVTTPDYTAPQSSASMDKTTVTLDESYDQAWEQLINFTSSRFFAIDNYEKDSGLMTLSFSSEPGRFINCGQISTDGPPSYEGDYVQWFSERPATLDLDGRMNLNVREVAQDQTEIDVNVRYVVTATGTNGVQAAQWSFNTGGSDTQQVRANNFGATQTRTCQPTHEAEEVIINGIQDV